MGMFDSVKVYRECPSCGKWQDFDAQTKDLDCAMDTYRPLPLDWETNEIEKKFRVGLPVFRKFPLDKEADVWKNQAERQEAQATIAPEYAEQLKFVRVLAGCKFCDKSFEGRVKVEKGKLVGDIEISPNEPS